MRDTKTRKADVLAALERQQDLWIATADGAGRPHLIAVSAWWDGAEIVIATTASSRTAFNLARNPTARLAQGTPGDAVVIDAKVVESRPAAAAGDVAGGFAAAVGWDPREVGPGWSFYRLKPVRIQAYRGYDELEGRDVMLRSEWLV
ncbi:MAG TPA: pyridoxamine 5'-phosphate oxidase family protein [Patescibacteria group bacterium]|nr:pyridoxamine 5'-phosphate oxidase family protein [Patescibacteria group bacterium]